MLKESDPEAYQLLVALAKMYDRYCEQLDKLRDPAWGKMEGMYGAARAFLAAQEKASKCFCGKTGCEDFTLPSGAYGTDHTKGKPAAEPETAEALLERTIGKACDKPGDVGWNYPRETIIDGMNTALAKLKAQREALEEIAVDLEERGGDPEAFAARIRKALG